MKKNCQKENSQKSKSNKEKKHLKIKVKEIHVGKFIQLAEVKRMKQKEREQEKKSIYLGKNNRRKVMNTKLREINRKKII